MRKLCFTATIDAERGTVWERMLAPETYRIWTAEFCEGSTYEGSWDQGERIRFVGPDGSGMTSVIAVSRPHEVLSIQHLGVVKNGVEDTTSEEATKWAPAFETYSFADADGATVLTVEIDVPPDFEEYMTETWPKALARLKEVCERRPA